jgi:hypothetical protein
MQLADPLFNSLIGGASNHLEHPKSRLLSKILEKYELKASLSMVAGIATVPSFQANSYRIELLTHLIVSRCCGRKIPTWQHMNHWLNRHVGDFDIAKMEDPPEDTFVVNVITPEGDFRILGGLWESADSATTLLIETLMRIPVQSCHQFQTNAATHSILKLPLFPVNAAALGW